MLKILTLPELKIFVNGIELVDLNRRRNLLALVVYLAVKRTATRDTVTSMFWPDKVDNKARHALNQSLHELRQLLRCDWLDSRGGKLIVAPSVETDLANFEAAIQERRFDDAFALYRGKFLDGVHLAETAGFESWVDLCGAQAARLFRRTCREVLTAHLRDRDLNGALAIATRWTELEPLDDEAQQRLIELLARLGRRAEAIRHFEIFENRLRREELEPMPELVDLAATLRERPFATQAGQFDSARELETATDSAGGDSMPTGLPPDLEIVRLLGEGTSARVYLARERSLGRLVALKILSPRSLLESVAFRRFEREARATARIEHPNVVPVYRSGLLPDGAPYLVMQYFDGGSLQDRLEALGQFAIPEARRFIGQIAAGLSAAHRNHIIHRDVRPANVMYDRHANRVLLTDFGTARLTETGDAEQAPLTRPGDPIGLPTHASPEQLKGEPLTERSDVYSLGVVAFQLLAGRLPFLAQTPIDISAAQINEPAPSVRTYRPEVDPILGALIGRCLQKRPEQRPFAGEIANLLLIL